MKILDIKKMSDITIFCKIILIVKGMVQADPCNLYLKRVYLIIFSTESTSYRREYSSQGI